ncbi:hypothetical protein FLM48_15125 [Shewanella sp. Scap07]|uniref:hypothetical protein n=1 Tax=Shewanella sp. Scap07 TaxID=2589987 RepID=UPI0015B96416|nr:hypothetical protein [Shewanella sp. Scap07]QLE86287.1 hypothetical protein FLM48_15125 [Shewanella sp. Scap07]
MKSITRWCVLGLSAVIVGCSVSATPLTDKAEPALRTDNSAEGTEEMKQAIAQLLALKQVNLSKQAFAQQSSITIERTAHKVNGQLIMGRNYEMPQQVNLLTEGGRCYVSHPKSQQSQQLFKVHCQPQ